MKKTKTQSTGKLTEKFDNQLLDILAAELRAVRYAKNKIMEHMENHSMLVA